MLLTTNARVSAAKFVSSLRVLVNKCFHTTLSAANENTSNCENSSLAAADEPSSTRSTSSPAATTTNTPQTPTKSNGFRFINLKKQRTLIKPSIEVTFQFEDDDDHRSAIKVKGRSGDTLLDVAMDNGLQIDGFGACEGTLACSTCHVRFSGPDFARIGNKAADEELDMLDLASHISPTSRLGCQVFLIPQMNGIVAIVPSNRKDLRLD